MREIKLIRHRDQALWQPQQKSKLHSPGRLTSSLCAVHMQYPHRRSQAHVQGKHAYLLHLGLKTTKISGTSTHALCMIKDLDTTRNHTPGSLRRTRHPRSSSFPNDSLTSRTQRVRDPQIPGFGFSLTATGYVPWFLLLEALSGESGPCFRYLVWEI